MNVKCCGWPCGPVRRQDEKRRRRVGLSGDLSPRQGLLFPGMEKSGQVADGQEGGLERGRDILNLHRGIGSREGPPGGPLRFAEQQFA
jgi:hypothetical protein